MSVGSEICTVRSHFTEVEAAQGAGQVLQSGPKDLQSRRGRSRLETETTYKSLHGLRSSLVDLDNLLNDEALVRQLDDERANNPT